MNREPEQNEKRWNQLNHQIIELYNSGKYPEAIPLSQQALQLAAKIWGPTHPNVATSCNNLASLYEAQNRLEEAQRLLIEAIEIDRKALPKDHPSLATHLNNLASSYKSQNRLEEAEKLLIEAIEIDRKALPKDNLSLATHLNNLASSYKLQNRLEEAEKLLIEAIEIHKKALPKNHPSLASLLNNLAESYKSQNRVAEAEKLLIEAIEIHKNALPKYNPSLATHLNNLASLYASQNRLEEAEKLLIKAIEIHKKALPKNHPSLASLLNNLAESYKSQNRLEEAEKLLIEAIEIDRTVLSKDNPSLATHLNNLASLYASQHRLEKAEKLLIEAIEIDRKALPKNHPSLASHLNNLASSYKSQNRLEEAEKLLIEAIEIDRKALPKNHPSLASLLNNLAELYEKQNRLEEAERLLIEAIEIDRKALPKDHPYLASLLNNLALLLAKTDRPLAAFKRMLQANKIDKSNIQRYFGASSESERLAYLQSIKHRFEVFLSLIYQHLSHWNAAKQTALNLVLKRKALTAAAKAAFNSAIIGDRYPHLQDTFRQWRQLSDKLLQLSYDIPSPEEVAPRLEELARVQKQCRDIETFLAREVLEIRLQEQSWDRKAVAISLPAGASLIEFLRLDVYNFKESRYQDARYFAFILPAGQPFQVEIVDLGDAVAIDNLISQFREALINREKSSNQEIWDDPPTDSQSVPKLHLYNKNAGCQLRREVFDKLRPLLGSCRNLFLAPDGDLNLAPLGILPLEQEEKTLRDEYAINFVSSGRELLRNSIDVSREPGPALIVGAPNYDFGSGDNSPPAANTGKIAATLPDFPFKHVPATRNLAAAVAQRLGAEALLGDDALVGELLRRRSPKILFLATRGFLKRGRQDYYQLVLALLNCPNGEEEKILRGRGHLLDKEFLEVAAEVATQLTENDNEKTASWLRQFAQLLEPKINHPAAPSATVYRLDAKVEDPMLRTGIALAGANTWSWGGKLPPEAGTGIMFARDMAALDLMATELVILVACQSGLGDVATGEGVFGLRRAVAVAGAKTLIMSLWSVPAYATILLMERLFDSIDAGWQPAEALEMAQDYVKNVTIGELNESKLGERILRDLGIFIGTTRKSHPLEMKPLEHPYYWGAWVCQGVAINN